MSILKDEVPLIELKSKIDKCLKEQNHFWWGCVLGMQYGKLNTIRVSKKEEPNDHHFIPIIRIRYGSPYPDGEKIGEIVKWYSSEIEKLITLYHL